MTLTAFEQAILSIRGDYSREMRRLFNLDISENNAKKQITGMNMDFHLGKLAWDNAIVRFRDRYGKAVQQFTSYRRLDK